MIEQDTNKEYLKKLLDFLQTRILLHSANHWFAEDLYRILAPVSDVKILDIHEQCIESIIQEQASNFYKDFVLDILRPQLIADFIKMEHWRRRNNVQEFCLALYQQIEAITNYLGNEKNLNIIWRNIRTAGFFVDFDAKDIRVRWDDERNQSIESSIIYKKDNYKRNGYSYDPELKELLAMDKFKAIIFLIIFQTDISIMNINYFNEFFWTGFNIYQVRNLNHRGKLAELSDRLKSIIEHPTFSMCYMLGFYARFIAAINKNYPITKELVEFAEICCKRNNV